MAADRCCLGKRAKARVLSVVLLAAFLMMLTCAHATPAYGIESGGSDSSTAVTQSIDTGSWGECLWELTGDGTLHLKAGRGADTKGVSPWAGHSDSITAFSIEGAVIAPVDCSSLFKGLEKMASIEGLWSFDTSDSVNMASMFEGCLALSSLALPDAFYTRNVTDMSGMFSGCEALQTLSFSATFNTSNVRAMNAMFSGCSGLTSLELPQSFDTSKVTNMNSMFRNCAKLNRLTLPAAFDTTSTTRTREMFKGTGALTIVTIKGDRFTLSNVFPAPPSGDGAHTGRWREVGNGVVENPKGASFDDIPVRTPGTYVPELVSSGTWGECTWNITDDDALTIKAGPIGNKGADTGGTSPWKSFAGRFKKVVFEEDVVAPADCSGLFRVHDSEPKKGTMQLEAIEGLEHLDTSNTENMHAMFTGYNKLTSLRLPDSFDTSSVRNMSYMFDSCQSLTFLSLPASFVTSKVADMSHMFNCCKNLTSLVLPEAFDTSNVAKMNNMFGDCSLLTSLVLPDAFATSNVESMSSMFDGCASLQSLALPAAFDTSNATKTDDLFKGVKSLLRLELKGEGFTLEGALPAPGVSAGDGTYTGRWREVGSGSDVNPLGEAYDAVPVRTAGVFVPDLVRHTVSCALADGTIYDTQEVNHGVAAVRPVDPAQEGFTFIGWSLPGGSAYDWAAPVVSDVVLSASFSAAPRPLPPPADEPKGTPEVEKSAGAAPVGKGDGSAMPLPADEVKGTPEVEKSAGAALVRTGDGFTMPLLAIAAIALAALLVARRARLACSSKVR